MAVVPIRIESTGDRELLRNMAEIVDLSKQAQREIADIANVFGGSVRASRTLVEQMEGLLKVSRSQADVLLRLDKRLDATSKSMVDLGKNSKTAQTELSKLGAGIRVTGVASGRSQRSVDSLSVAIGNLASQAAFRVMDLLAEAIRRVATSSVEAALAVQGFVRALDFSSAGEGVAIFNQLVESSDALGVSLAKVAPEFSKLSAAAQPLGITMADQLLLFEGLLKASTELGISSDVLARAFTALEQVISKNLLTSEELRGQLAEAIPGAIELAIQAVGGTREEFVKFLESGISATEFIPAFARLLNTRFVGAADTAQAELARLNNAVFALKTALGEELLPVVLDVAGAFQELVTGDNLDTIIANAQRLSLIFSGILELLIGTSDIAQSIRDDYAQLYEVLQRLLPAFQVQQRLTEAISNAWARTTGEILALFEALGRVRRSQEEVTEAVEKQEAAQAELQETSEETTGTLAEQLRLAEEKAKADKEAADAAERELKARKQQTSQLLNEEAKLREQTIDDAEAAELEAIDNVFAAREAAIRKTADIAASFEEERIDSEQRIAEARLEAEQDAQQKLLATRFDQARRQIEDEIAIREGASRSLLQQEAREAARIAQQLERVRGGELIDRDALELAQEILFPGRSPQQIQFIDEETLRQIQELLPQLRQAQEQGLASQQLQERAAQEALFNSERIIAEQSIAEIRRNEELSLLALREEQAKEIASLEAQAAIEVLALEADAKQQQRDLDKANAEEIARLNLQTAERVADIRRQNLNRLEQVANPIPRFRGGNMYPGNVYEVAERGEELVQMGGKTYLVKQRQLMMVPQPAMAVPLPKAQPYVPTPSSSNADLDYSLQKIDKGIEKLNKAVEQRPIQAQTVNHFGEDRSTWVTDMTRQYRAQARAIRSNL